MMKAREKSIWFYAAGVCMLGVYFGMSFAASEGSLGSTEAYASMFWTGVFFYLLWKDRARKGWHGALIGVGVGVAAFMLAAFMGGFVRH